MTDGRLTTDELEARLGALYAAQTRAQARSVLTNLPPLDPSGAEQPEATLVLPDWATLGEADGPAATPSGRPTGGVAASVPTDGEMHTAYRRWHAKSEKLKADKAAHQQAEASGDPREAVLAFKLKISRGEEKSARVKLDQLRKRRPDWIAEERPSSKAPERSRESAGSDLQHDRRPAAGVHRPRPHQSPHDDPRERRPGPA
jgi:hypothetical protein